MIRAAAFAKGLMSVLIKVLRFCETYAIIKKNGWEKAQMSIPFYESKHGYAYDYAVSFYNGGSGFPPHLHRCFEIIVSLSAGTTVKIDGQTYLLDKNDIVIIKPYQVHEIYDARPHFYYLFSSELIHMISDDLINYELTSPVAKNASGVLESLTVDFENTNLPFKKGILYILASCFFDKIDYSKKMPKSKDKTVLQRIFEYVEENTDKSCKMDVLSKELGYAPSYLSRLFSSNVGMPYSEYVRIIKMNKACNYLENTDYTVLDIAIKCGYSSLASFNRVFNSVIKENPTDFRRRRQKE